MRPERFGPAAPFEITPEAREAAACYEDAKRRGDRPALARAERELIAALGRFVDPLRSVEIEGVVYWYGLGNLPALYRIVTERRAAPAPRTEKPAPPPELLTKRQAAALLGISFEAFENRAWRHGIQPTAVGPNRVALFTREQVEKIRIKGKLSPVGYGRLAHAEAH